MIMMDKSTQIKVREAHENDVSKIQELFEEIYGGHYPHHSYKDITWLKRSVFNDDILMLVAEDTESREILGTASVLFDMGAHSDLVGEFGRLVVSPKCRDRGIGKLLMKKRIEFIQNRLHVGIVENRCVHDFSQKIAHSQGFAVVGFLPVKLLFRERECVALFARHFGNSLTLRRNNPRIIPESHTLAHFALKNCGLPFDGVIDEESTAYPRYEDFELEELTTRGLPSLLRIERGRVHHKEVFGPMGLHYGFFRLHSKHATYLIAREKGQNPGAGPVAGAIGYIPDEREKTVRVFELITTNDQSIRYLLEHLLERCREKLKTTYIEVDVSAHAPRMQRTLLELGFQPAAYIPAMVFHNVERLDIVRMVKLEIPFKPGDLQLIPSVQEVADRVIQSFKRQEVLPEISKAVNKMTLFSGLNEEQSNRLAGICSIGKFRSGEKLFSKGEPANKMYIVIEGEVTITLNDTHQPVGQVLSGEPVGEVSFLTGEHHSATAVAKQPILLAVLTKNNLAELIRLRPDIGLALFQNLALSLGRKLQRTDADLTG
jgi:GNAT superfamily N-acetyltransferase